MYKMKQLSPVGPNQIIFCLLFICILVYLLGWLIPLMEIDAAQYANISREMLGNKQYIQVYDLGKDYLDKPPMLFWLSALSMKIFGISDFSYRLPSYLFSILAIYSTYQFSLLFYNKLIAWLSALVLASCQAMFLITHDVKTDTMLMGWVILSLWQLAAWFSMNRWKNLILAAVAIAGGLMTKGPIALMVPVFAFAPHFILKRNFSQLFRWQYLIILIILAILLFPMSWGLYLQYDLHPEKMMYGQRGLSGLRFFYWTQSFGRITGESTWHENDSFFFQFENMLWGFLPWILFFILGLMSEIRTIFHKKFIIENNEEWISTGGFLLTYSALGMSKFQLPHYIYVVFPLAAIVTAKWLYKLLYTDSLKKWIRPLLVVHAMVFFLLWMILLLLLIVVFPSFHQIPAILCSVSVLFLIYILLSKKQLLPRLLTLCVGTILIINIFLDTSFYPPLLEYQLSIPVSRFINLRHLPKDRIFLNQISEERSLDFYCKSFFKRVDNPDSLQSGDFLVTSREGYKMLDSTHFIKIYQGDYFHVSTLSLQFLNPASRGKETNMYFLLQKR